MAKIDTSRRGQEQRTLGETATSPASATTTGAAVVESQHGSAPTFPVARLDDKLLSYARKIDTTAISYAQAIDRASGHTERALLMAEGIRALREQLSEDLMTRHVMPLMNDQNGFRCDRPSKSNPNSYTVPEVRNCVVTALIQGLYLIGNEFNIIAGQCFVTQNGWRRKFEELPGISDITIAPGQPVNRDGQWSVRVKLSWLMDGKNDQLIGTDDKPGQAFTVECHGAAKSSQLIGKAIGDAYQAAYRKATGSKLTLAALPGGDVDERGLTSGAGAAGAGNAGQPALPAVGSRSAQVLDHLKAQQSAAVSGTVTVAITAETREKINTLITEKQIFPDDLENLAGRLKIPALVNAMTETDGQKLLKELEAMPAVSGDDDAERAAMQGEQ